MLPLLTRAGLALIGLFLIAELLASTGHRPSAPYFDNFDSYPNGGLPANFTGSHADGWTISNDNGTSGRYVSTVFSTPVPDYAHSEVRLANVPGKDFTVSTKFTATTFTSGTILDASVGLIALSSSDPSVFPTDCYTLEYFVASGMGSRGRLEPRGGGASWQGNSLATILDVGQGLTMSLRGEYVGGTLFLTATVSNGIGTIVFHGTDTSPLNGPYFGYWDRVSGTTSHFAQMSVYYDDFAVTFTTASNLFGNISTRLADPILALHDKNDAVLASNDNRRRSAGRDRGYSAGASEQNKSAILADLLPNKYSAVVRGKNNVTGVALIELYHLN